MDQEYSADFITITDEDGKEYELEVLSSVIYQDKEYLALVPADVESDEELEVSILRRDTEDGEEILSTVDDEDELEAVYELLMDQMYAEDGEEE